MYKKGIRWISIIVFNMIIVSIHADTLTVKQDGTGDYLNIQNAINGVVNGDIVLIYPGVYPENIVIGGKNNVQLASLFLLTNQDTMISSTIIDGSGMGSCIRAINSEQNLIINGITLKNGNGSVSYGLGNQGGGIGLLNAEVSILNCNLIDNYAHMGGGIFASFSELVLSNVRIVNNHAAYAGGGIFLDGSSIMCDSLKRCNLYLNYAGLGSDYTQNFLCPQQKLYLDTATVISPDHYLISSPDGYGNQNGNISWDVLNGRITYTDANIYIDPNGNDNNSGLTLNDPLKTISYALLKIGVDSVTPNSIYLAPGVYSHSTNGERLLLQLKSYVPIIGSDVESTIIDAEGNTNFSFVVGEKDIRIRNIQFINGNSDLQLSGASALTSQSTRLLVLDSVKFYNCSGVRGALTLEDVDSAFIRNSYFIENVGTRTISAYNNFRSSCFVEFESCKVSYNEGHQDYDGIGVGIGISGHGLNNPITCFIINSEITENKNQYASTTIPLTSGIALNSHATCYLVNSTVGSNFADFEQGGALGLSENSTAYVYNSILYDNLPYQVLLYNNYQNDTNRVFFYNSLIEGGIDGILNLDPNNIINVDTSCIDSDPMWADFGLFPYAISAESPCIDEGTLNLPQSIQLPNIDLSGNPRIQYTQIDIGAYEYGLWVDIDDKNEHVESVWINAYPIPFSNCLNIDFVLPEGGDVMILTYDIYGRCISSYSDHDKSQGQYSIKFNGVDLHGKPLSEGIYIIKLLLNDTLLDSLKVIKSHP